MKKKISLVLAFLMAATMLAGCKKTDEETAGLPEVATTTAMSELTQMTVAETEETTVPEVTTTEETTTTTEAETTTEATTTEATTVSAEADETTTAASETEASETTTAKPTEWSETEISETLYVVSNCYSRVKAVVGSESVKAYKVGTEINIVAATDTGYYKLADGTFIHSDYVSDQKPSVTAKVEDDDNDNGGSSEEKPSSKPSKISSSYNKSYEDRYPYQQLSSSEKELYRNFVESAYAFDPEVAVPDGLMYEDIFKVYSMVFSQEPQLFWLPSSAPRGYGTVTIDYAFSQDEAAAIQEEIDDVTKDVMSVVGGYSSTVSRLKAIYDWVVTNNYNEVGGSIGTLGVYNGIAGNGSLQCQGYAKTFQYLCDVAGIDCMVVTGNNAEGTSHAWNVVYCDNGYYIVDTTWGDPRTDYGKNSYVRYLFFLANDAATENTHVNVSTMYINSADKRIKIYEPPACTKTACYYFNAYDKTYDNETDAYNGMCAEIKAAVKAGKNVAHIRVTDYDLWETMRSDSYWKKYQNYAKELSGDVDKLKRQTTLTEDILVIQFDIVYK
ncbi:MAG: hypothetical protein IKK42_05980 [Oscillospiraceae bacterium]|nr:hypothetical protein [Oscillospiraceae bacterium]